MNDDLPDDLSTPKPDRASDIASFVTGIALLVVIAMLGYAYLTLS
jgi:hypothetical protein